MNREQTIEAIKVMQAWVGGKDIQARLKGSGGDWHCSKCHVLDFESFDYRIKPTATLRPWTADEVPLGAWMRFKAANSEMWIITSVGKDRKLNDEWVNACEHSTDGGKTWLPCGVMEEDK